MLRTLQRRGLHSRGAVALALLAIAACADEAEPQPPDLARIVQAYEAPDAELDAAQVQQLVAAAQPMLSAARVASGFEFLVASIDSTKQGLEARGLDGTLELEGSATVRSICPGLTADGIVDETTDGFIELVVPIEDAALGPVAFGSAQHCRFGQPVRAQLDGPIAIHFGAPLAFGTPITPTPIVRIDGVLAIEGVPPLAGLDVRLPAPGITEARIVLPTGATAVLVVSDTSFGVRERRGTWQCPTQGGAPCVAWF